MIRIEGKGKIQTEFQDLRRGKEREGDSGKEKDKTPER